MKKTLALLAVTLVFAGAVFSQSNWSEKVTFISPVSNDSVIAEGDFGKGIVLNDLSWASSSSNACFTAVQFQKFQGKHVFFGTTLPPGSVMTIKAAPGQGTEEVSLYGYMLNSRDYSLVPELKQCITCEADYKRDRPVRGKPVTNQREVEFRNPTSSSYNIIIGVTGPKESKQGKFIVTIKTVS